MRAVVLALSPHLAQLSEVDVRTLQRLARDGACSKETLMAIAEAFNRDAVDLPAEPRRSRARRRVKRRIRMRK
jgi:hypothetical protein